MAFNEAAYNAPWDQIKEEYTHDPRASCPSLAKKYKISVSSIRHRVYERGWKMEREAYLRRATQVMEEKLIAASVNRLEALNERQLRWSAEVKHAIDMMLKVAAADGRVMLRPECGLEEWDQATVILERMFKLDRLALGVVSENGQPTDRPQRDRVDEMSDEDVKREIDIVLARLNRNKTDVIQ